MREQLALPVTLRDGNTLSTFLPAHAPEALLAVQALLAGRESLVWLWGPPSSGRTHLLEAAAGEAARAGLAVAFLVPADPALPGPAVLDGLGETVDLVCIDDIDRVAGDADWEEAFFHLFNALAARGARLLVSAQAPPAAAGFRLPDLASRMALCLTVALPALDDAARLDILAFRAAGRGLELPPETGRYLLARTSRRLADLVALLDRLDRAALVHRQQRLTIPFARQVLDDPARVPDDP